MFKPESNIFTHHKMCLTYAGISNKKLISTTESSDPDKNLMKIKSEKEAWNDRTAGLTKITQCINPWKQTIPVDVLKQMLKN